MTRMPSLTALRAFEAAARLGSMTRAAEELCVTHGAISRQIQTLERDLGITLLRRLPGRLEPTPEGARLAARVSEGFDAIRAGVKALRPGPLVLSCSASLTIRWLIPRLADFKSAHPGIVLQLSASHGAIDLAREEIDVAIRNDVVPPPAGVQVRPLAREKFGPVCTPEYARAHGFDLARMNILSTKTRPDAWTEWAQAAGRDGRLPPVRDTFEHFYVMLQAALCGLGVAAAPRILVEDDLRLGTLVAPLGFVEGQRSLVLWRADSTRRRTEVAALEHWLEEQIRASG